MLLSNIIPRLVTDSAMEIFSFPRIKWSSETPFRNLEWIKDTSVLSRFNFKSLSCIQRQISVKQATIRSITKSKIRSVRMDRSTDCINLCTLDMTVWRARFLQFFFSFAYIGVQGWRSGESTRLPPMWPGFDSQTGRHMWVELLVLYSAPRGFLRVLRFPLSSKKTTFDLTCFHC